MHAPAPEDVSEALARFGVVKQADLLSIIPSVAAPALGGYLGRALTHGSDVGTLLGGITGGVAGQYYREELPKWRGQQSGIPAGAPYAIDPSTENIPPWALQGAQLLQPAMNQSGSKTSGALDWILGEVPGGNVVQRGIKGFREGGLGRGLGQAGKAFAGMTGGGVPGALLGLGLGKGIEHLTGHGSTGVNIPLVNIKLHELLAGLGGTVGATKGLQYMTGQGH